MKKLVNFFILIFFSSLLMTCAEHENFDYLIISDSSISKEDITLKIIDGKNIPLDKHTEEILLKYINETFDPIINSVPEVEKINSLTIENVIDPNTKTKNLIFSLSSFSSEPMPSLAIVFKANSLKSTQYTSFFAKKKHYCQGAPCGCCDFLRDPTSNSITGCICNGNNQDWGVCKFTEGQFCNHSVVTVE